MIKGDKKIYDSMTTNIKIIIQNKNNVAIIPNTAIQTIDNTTAVQIMQPGGISQVQAIEVGISDGTNSEILSGVTVGTKILLKAYKASSSTSSKSSSSDAMKSAGSSTRSLGVGGSSSGGPMGAGPGM